MSDSELDIEDAYDALAHLQAITATTDLTTEEKVNKLLETSAEALGFPIAYFTDIEAGSQQIVAAVGDHDAITAGAVDPLEKTYCRKTVGRTEPLVLEDAEADGWADDPAFEQFGLRCYIGASVEVDGSSYGTVCFADTNPRPGLDATVLRTIADVIAQWIGYELERAEYEQELQRRERKYRHLFEESRDALLLFDEDGLVDSNAAAVELFSAQAHDALRGRSPRQLLDASGADGASAGEAVRTMFGAEMADRKRQYQHPVVRLDGTVFEADITLSSIDLSGDRLVQARVRDMSDRIEREQFLRLFRRGVEQASHSIFVTEPDGTIIYVNPAFETQTGYDRQEAIGEDPSILKSGKQSDEFYRGLWETILGGETWEADIVNRRKSGELYQVRQEISPITDDGGEITHFVAIQSDVTDRRLREQQLDVFNRILRHNIRNEMTKVSMQTDSLRQTGGDEQLAHAAKIDDAVESLTKLSAKATTVRSLFRQERDREQSIRVADAVEPVIDECEDRHPDITIDVDVPDGLRISGDNRLRVALEELLENAVVHNDQAVPKIELTATRYERTAGNEWIDIVVADNGPGIPEHEQEPFETGTETELRHSSGLDLWIVYWAASLLGGELSISSRSPRGSKVTLTLPAAN